MYATKNPPRFSTTSTATLHSVSSKVTRLFVDETLAQATPEPAAKKSYTCRCSESKVDPTIMCPSHWLSFTLQFSPAVH